MENDLVQLADREEPVAAEPVVRSFAAAELEQGVVVPASVLERDVLPARMRDRSGWSKLEAKANGGGSTMKRILIATGSAPMRMPAIAVTATAWLLVLGYAGHGVAMATYLGTTVAEAMLKRNIREHPFASFDFPSAPLGLYNGFPWFLPLACSSPIVPSVTCASNACSSHDLL